MKHKLLLIVALALLLVPTVLADVDVLYTFKDAHTGNSLNDVQGSTYNCANAECSQSSSFSGSVSNSSESVSTTDFEDANGVFQVTYPTNRNPHDYAVIFVRKGYMPMVSRSTWHGNSNTRQQTIVPFYKVSHVCRAVVSNLNFVNEAKPHIPMVVHMTAKMDAQTASAFRSPYTSSVKFMPTEFAQEHYGADTRVIFEIFNSNGLRVHQQTREFTAENGNAIIAGTTVPVQFTYVPTQEGDFTVRVTSQIIDDQCSGQGAGGSEESSGQGTFSVLEDEPEGQFYTILNQLKVNDTHPQVGTPVLVTYNKITNHADGNQVLTAVQTNMQEKVTLNGNTVFSRSRTLFENPTTTDPVTYSFTFVPQNEGVYNISVFGEANSQLPVNNAEVTDTESFLMDVRDEGEWDVSFEVRDAESGLGLENATVTLSGEGSKLTDNGSASFNNVPAGTYTYTINKTDYQRKSRTITISSNRHISTSLRPGNDPMALNADPELRLPDSITIAENDSETFNYFNYVFDQEDRDEDLALSLISGHDNLTVTINTNTGLVRIKPDDDYKNSNGVNLQFQLNDTMNATDNDIITVIVEAETPANRQNIFNPQFVGLPPSITTPEDIANDQLVDLLNLRNYVTDQDTPVDDLSFSVDVDNDTLATARITQRSMLSIYPKPDQFGKTNITVTVTDGIGSVDQNITLNVTPINDAPQIISIPPLLMGPESQNVTFNLSHVFFDPDGDVLSYHIDSEENLSFEVDGMNITVIPDFNVSGVRKFNITANDSKLAVKAQFSINLTFVDDIPRFTQTFPSQVGAPDTSTFVLTEDIPNSRDLTPYESDPEDGGPDDFNSLVWKMRLANETNATPGLVINTSLFDAEIVQSNQLDNETLVITPRANQSGSLNITLYLFDSAGNNATQDVNITIVDDEADAPAFVNLANQNAQAGVLFSYQLNATDPDTVTNVVSYSIANISPALPANVGPQIDANDGNFTVNATSNGQFNVTIEACDNDSPQNCVNGTFTLTVSDNLAPMFVSQTNPTNPTTYMPGAVYTFQVTVADNGNVSNVTLDFDGTLVNGTETSTNVYEANVSNLSAGSYPFHWIATDSAGNQNTTNSTNFNITQAQPAMVLTLNGNANNISVAQGSQVNITANVTNTTGTVTILNDGNQIASGNTNVTTLENFPTQGDFNITARFAGNQNYSAGEETFFVNVPDTVAPTFSNQQQSPASPAAFNPLYTFQVDVDDNVAVSTVTFELDNATNTTASQVGNSNTWEVNLTNIAVGSHSFNWYANDTAGNENSTSEVAYTVTQGAPVIALTINGVAGNTNAQVNDTVNITANVTNPAGGTVTLYVNGTQVANGASPQTFSTSFANTGAVNVTAEFAGNVNVSAGNVTHVLTIIPPIAVVNLLPASGTHFNSSSTAILVDTNNVTTCAWDFNDLAQANMANNFNTVNGTRHTSVITNMSLGNNDVHISCNNQGPANNTDIIYTVDNILDGSQLSGTNTFTDTIMTNSVLDSVNLTNVTGTNTTLTNVTGTDSNISNTTLTHCVVDNSTVLKITASNCNFVDSFVDPSDLTGTTVQNSVIIESDVTHSTVIDSRIEYSTINGSRIVNSTIMNSTFANANVTDANITNGTIFAGAITVTTPNGTFTWNVSTNGTANLSEVIPVQPVAAFTPTSKTITKNQKVNFNDASTDDNVGGPLNDSLTYFWNFGDGSNSTAQNPSHKYTSQGTFSVTLTVTDSFGLKDQTTGTVKVNKNGGGGGGGGGSSGGGGGGGGGGLTAITVTNEPTTRTAYVGQPLRFRVNGETYLPTLYLRRTNQDDGTSQWMLSGGSFTLITDQVQSFDLSGDGVPELDVTVLDVGRTSTTLRLVASSGSPAPAPLDGIPFANFGTTRSEPVKEEGVDVPVVAEVGEPVELGADSELQEIGMITKVKDFFGNLTGRISADNVGVKVGIVLAVIIIGIIAYALFVRWEQI